MYVYSTAGTDYNSGPYTVTFPAGVTGVAFNVSIINDNVLEKDESFILTIAVDSLPSKIANTTIAQASVTITDNDSKYW